MADAAPELAPSKSHYVLDDLAWGMIREAYQSGVTAKVLAKTWRVAVSTLYGRASRHGWTKSKRGAEVSKVMVARERERRALQAQIEGEAEAAAAPREADPITAARTLLRRAAGSALGGRGGPALQGMKLASELLRCTRLLSQAQAPGRRGAGDWRGYDEEEDDEDDEPEGWRQSSEGQALDAQVMRGLARIRVARGRSPPQALPGWFMLEDYAAMRPLAEALGLIVEGQAWVECADFAAAMSRARAEGRGEAVDRALTEPVPLELCTWLSEEEKAQVVACEAEAERPAEQPAVGADGALRWPDDEPPAAAAAAIEALGEGDAAAPG